MGTSGRKIINVLIAASSRRVHLVRLFREAVGKFGKGRMITTDINPLSPALYFGHKHLIVPFTTDRYYIPIIESICDVEDVSLIIPTIDDELPVFGRDSFDSGIGRGFPVLVAADDSRHGCALAGWKVPGWPHREEP